jgi:hypothetical protein
MTSHGDKADSTETTTQPAVQDGTPEASAEKSVPQADQTSSPAKPAGPTAEEKAAKKAERRQAAAERRHTASKAVDQVRSLLAQLLWILFLVAALFLAVAALLIALDANRDNQLVDFVLQGANRVDLGVFSRQDGIKQFGGDNAATKNALFNYGIGAVCWLVVGRIVDRIVRP